MNTTTNTTNANARMWKVELPGRKYEIIIADSWKEAVTVKKAQFSYPATLLGEVAR